MKELIFAKLKPIFLEISEVLGISTYIASFGLSVIKFVFDGQGLSLLITSSAGAVVILIGGYVKYLDAKMKKEKHDAEMREINHKYEVMIQEEESENGE
jgi:hypothetical protein